jgi:hypothetical protein
MTAYTDWKRRWDALSDRDRQIYNLARKATNALGFALQNAHNDAAVIRYEKQSDAALGELFELLSPSVSKESKP